MLSTCLVDCIFNNALSEQSSGSSIVQSLSHWDGSNWCFIEGKLEWCLPTDVSVLTPLKSVSGQGACGLYSLMESGHRGCDHHQHDVGCSCAVSSFWILSRG
ncbi:hypothetical protein chiPu_0018447 [Chiloscyllium punctatum]|uniref:Uncharacterized protein n=1 Tax=Chiloscyllium punctatum TaxID=137246 RepID=A0A401RND3_CHIPU|nr:hypothetical protein [Chiloscyllium punctatum]